MTSTSDEPTPSSQEPDISSLSSDASQLSLKEEGSLEGSLSSVRLRKVYVPDTNVLILNPFAPYILAGFDVEDVGSQGAFDKRLSRLVIKPKKDADGRLKDPNDVVILEVVEKELDDLNHHKDRQHVAISASHAIKTLRHLRKMDRDLSIDDHVAHLFENGAHLHFAPHDENIFRREFRGAEPFADDRIIYQIRRIQDANPDKEFYFVTQDTAAQNRAHDLGLHVDEFRYEAIADPTQPYLGRRTFVLPQKSFEAINAEASFPLSRVGPISRAHRKGDIYANMAIELRSRRQTDSSTVEQGRPEYRIVRSAPRKKGSREESARSLSLDRPKHYDGFMKFLDEQKDKAERQAAEMRGPFGKLVSSSSQSIEDIRDAVDSSLEEMRTYVDKGGFSKTQYTRMRKRAQQMQNNKSELEEVLNQLQNELASVDREMFLSNTRRISPALNHNLRPYNEQIPYVELLAHPDLSIVSCIGPQGSGKTLFATFVGMYFLEKKRYERVRYMKPIVGSDEGLGYLPGDLREKVDPWVQPFLDDLKEIMRYYEMSRDGQKAIDEEIKRLEKMGIINMELLTYVAGRTYRNEYLIIDEAHFFTRDQIKLLIGRIGEGTKMVLIGDPDQIGSSNTQTARFLTARNNGIAHLPASLRGKPDYGHISLPRSLVKRSRAAALAEYL
jgi:predicted ribonuclease YlaK